MVEAAKKDAHASDDPVKTAPPVTKSQLTKYMGAVPSEPISVRQPHKDTVPEATTDQPTTPHQSETANTGPTPVAQGTPKDPYDVPMDLPGEPKPKKRRKRGLLGLLAIVVLGAAAFGAYTFLGDKPKTANPTNSAAPTASNITTSEDDVPAVTASATYKNDTIGVTLTHPDSWKVTETTDRGVRIESPEFNYKTTNKGQAAGYYRLYIRLGARTSDSKYIGRGLAIAPSEKLTYTSPLPGQRKDTLLTNFGLDTTDNFAYFLIAGNFNLKKGDSLGPSFGKESETFIIGGGYSSKELTDDLATNTVPISYFNTTNAYKQAVDIVKSLQLR